MKNSSLLLTTSEVECIFLRFLHIFMQSLTAYMFIYFATFPIKWLIFSHQFIETLSIKDVNPLFYVMQIFFHSITCLIFGLSIFAIFFNNQVCLFPFCDLRSPILLYLQDYLDFKFLF